MITLALLSAPIGYAVLTGYLLYKIQPFPITFLPGAMFDVDKATERADTLAA